MEQKQRKSKKLGVVIKSDKNGKFYIILGSNKNKDPKYNFSVELVVRDSKGDIVHSQKDGLLSLLEPFPTEGANPNSKIKFNVLASQD